MKVTKKGGGGGGGSLFIRTQTYNNLQIFEVIPLSQATKRHLSWDNS